ncbi:MAG: CPBP family intramembrane glutamic endopeptidase, partial [Anaerolineae bacterium]|nr:CPBP family intramembrane glutamic endopeptidase [Anaerolineae bacterium]
GVRDHLRTYIHPRGSFAYYLLALFVLPAIWLVGNLLSRAFGMGAPFFRSPVVDLKLLGSATVMFLYNVAYSSLSEEPGWRGFALPRLQAKASPLVASLILGGLWAFWHVPLKFGGLDAASPSDILVEWILILLVNIIFTWLFNRTQGSILVTALLHPAMNVMGSFLNATLGALVLLFAFIIFIIVRDKMWRKLPAEYPAVYQERAPDLPPVAS